MGKFLNAISSKRGSSAEKKITRLHDEGNKPEEMEHKTNIFFYRIYSRQRHYRGKKQPTKTK